MSDDENDLGDVVVKEITEEDYGDVMKIRDPRTIYGGFDYLPDYYPVLIHKLGYKSYGVFVNGRLEGMAIAVVIDNGETLITRSGRISPKYEGHKFLRRLRLHVDGLYSPYVLRRSYAYSDAVDKVKEFTKANHSKAKILFEKVLHTYRTSQASIMDHLQNQQPSQNVKPYSQNDMKNLISSTEVCQHVFPENRIFVDHVPYRLLASNIPYILSHRCIMLGSNLDSDNNPDQWLVTFGNYVVCPAGILYNIDLYGQNINELYGHLLVHLDRLRIMTNTDVQVEIICDQKVDRAVCNKFMERLGFERVEFFRSYLVCAEISYKDAATRNNTNDSNSKL